PRVRAALPAGSESEAPPAATERVRVRRLTAGASFPLVLSVWIGAEFSRNQKELGITRDQMYDLMIMASEVIDELFDLRRGPFSPDNKSAIDLAYYRGTQDVMSWIHDFMELREKAPDKATALVKNAA